jgi:hypothetical protein
MALESVVQASIQALLEHYDQRIHYQTSRRYVSHDRNGGGFLRGDEADVDGKSPDPPPLPGILAVLWDRLQQATISSSSSNDTLNDACAAESSTRAVSLLPVLLLSAYATHIRRHIFPNMRRAGMNALPSQSNNQQHRFGETLDHDAWSRTVTLLEPYQLLVQRSLSFVHSKRNENNNAVRFSNENDDDDDDNDSLWLVVNVIIDDMVWWVPPPPLLDGGSDKDECTAMYHHGALVVWSRLLYAALCQGSWSSDWIQNGNLRVGSSCTHAIATAGHDCDAKAESAESSWARVTQSRWDILRHCVGTLLGIGHGRAESLLPVVGDWDTVLVATVSNPLSYCSHPLPARQLSRDNLTPSNQPCYQTPRSVVQLVGLVAASMSKPSTPETLELSQCLASIWKLLEQQLVSSTVPSGSPETNEPFNTHSPPSWPSETNEPLCHVQRRVLAALGWVECSRAVRAHFFGTDRNRAPPRSTSQALQLQPPRLHMGRTVTEPSTNNSTTAALSTTKPHHVQCSRWAATRQFVGLLPHTTPTIWLELAPVVYDLLHSAQEYDVQWGAVLLHRLLQLPCHHEPETSVEAIPPPHNRSLPLHRSSSEHGVALWHAWPDRAVLDNLATFLEQAVGRHRVGLTLAVLGVAQRALFHRRHEIQRYCREIQDDHVSARALFEQGTAAMLHTWLLILDRHSRHYTKQHLIWGLLYGGIVPLLYDAASAVLDPATGTASCAYCVEVGRLGLSALFSVLREESNYTNLFAGDHGAASNLDDILYNTSSKEDGTDNDDHNMMMQQRQRFELSIAVHMAALTALLNLIVAAHPIMEHHARKIMCELVAYLCKLHYVVDQGNAVDQLIGVSTPQASPATVPFGAIPALYQLGLHTAAVALVVCGEPAQCVLTHIESSDYNDRVLKVVAAIRRVALDMQAALATST